MNIVPQGTAYHAPAYDILGTPVLALDWSGAIALLSQLVAEGHFTPVSFLNAHNANVAARNPEFAAHMRRFMILPDGVGVDVAARLLYGTPFPANLNGTDFIPALLAANKRPLLVGLLGTTPHNVEAAADVLRARMPQHEYRVYGHGFFTAQEEAGILAALEAAKPDVLLVAMGVPRQELWIGSKLDARHCTMPVGVGALLDFLSGAVPRAPQRVRNARLEWAYRLWLEPSRLWRRYILGNPVFLWRVARQKFGKYKSHV